MSDQYKFTCPSTPHVGGANDTCIVMQILAKVHHVGVAVSGNDVLISSNDELTQSEIDTITAIVRSHNGDHLRRKHEARIDAAKKQAEINLTNVDVDTFVTAQIAREKLRTLHWEGLD